MIAHNSGRGRLSPQLGYLLHGHRALGRYARDLQATKRGGGFGSRSKNFGDRL